jgi:hypothetical protein
MDLPTLRKYYQLCRDEPLGPGDSRNLDIDRLPGKPRGVNWVVRLSRPIELSSSPVQTFVTGLPGSGKSTELRRLSERLSQSESTNLLVVHVDAEEALDLTSQIDIPDLYMVMIRAAEEKALEAEGRSPDEALQEGYLARLWHWLTTTDVELKNGFQIPQGKLTFEMKARPSLRTRVRETIANHLTTFLKEARDELVLIEERARRAGWGGIIVILDSLEKLRGISSSYEAVLQSAEKVFAGGAPYLRLPIHSILTVPAALATRQSINIEFMPMIKLHNRDGSTSKSGFDAMRELIRRRLPDEVLLSVLGADCEQRLRRVIDRSGGYPRELVIMLKWLLELPELPAANDDLERAENEVCERFRSVVMRGDFEWLARVAREQTLTVEDDGHRPIVDRALSNNIVLRYCNKEVWYDLHPAVRDIPGVAEAIKKHGKGGR